MNTQSKSAAMSIKEGNTVEELLKPRYKVIADYPDNEWEVGAVLTMKKIEGIEQLVTSDDLEIVESELQHYPHLFKKLEWWEDRKPEEMPEYVRDHKGEIKKVIKWSVEYFIYEKESSNPIVLPNVEVSFSVISYYQPATKEEYNNQNQQS